jgi:hypothetical protein
LETIPGRFLKQVTLQERLYDAEPTAGLLFNLLEKQAKEFPGRK